MAKSGGILISPNGSTRRDKGMPIVVTFRHRQNLPMPPIDLDVFVPMSEFVWADVCADVTDERQHRIDPGGPAESRRK
ncbi:hypothetical protein [Schlesneria paludicola]|uniref:hypothetical protein n=1 Tax=Schlesneria paludicola TaxID=360056 RepID=UPI00029A3CF5|nr:hypothetical protein [Schlesneria paludicola]